MPNVFVMNNDNLEELKCFLSEKINAILSERLLDISGTVEELKLELKRRPALCDTSFDQEETSTQQCVFPVLSIDQNLMPNRFTGESSDYSVENFKFAVEMYLGN